jgi:membrane protein YqaA with SNARE-associated domain
MCPVCLTNAALIAAGATSSGGLTAFMMNKFYGKKRMNQARGKKNESKRDGTRN